MVTRHAPSTGHQAARSFDVALSLTLDNVIFLLDAGPTGIRRRWLLLRKMWYERHVPAWHPGEVPR
jgi:hypothetical protein